MKKQRRKAVEIIFDDIIFRFADIIFRKISVESKVPIKSVSTLTLSHLHINSSIKPVLVFLHLVNDVTGQNNLNPVASGSRFPSIVETKVRDSLCYIKGTKTQ